MALELHRLTREYVWWKITTDEDLTGATAEIAFTDAVSVPSTWLAADLVLEDTVWYVRQLISGTAQGGTVELTEGDHQSWVRLTDNPERPVRKSGIVTIL